MKKKILIFAKTYPQPSKKYDETVCTGGVLEDGTFVRLYPISFRYLPYESRFRRYQWIEADITKDTRDNRKESFRVDQKSIITISAPLSTKNAWAARREFILKKLAKSVEHLKDMQKQDGTSLGIIKPKEITDFFTRSDSAEWKRTHLMRRSQVDLFKELKPLDKLPYRFTFEFRCDDERCNGHSMMISDWEVYALFQNCRKVAENDALALAKVKDKVFHDLCSERRDSHFFLGTIRNYPKSWIIVGMFYPPRPKPIAELDLFQKNDRSNNQR